jgi:orotate phosphoribosyltransferase-like protein
MAAAHYRCIARRAQGFTAQQTANEFFISARTVGQYLERAKKYLANPDTAGYAELDNHDLRVETIQDAVVAFHLWHSPVLWCGGDRPGGQHLAVA